MAIPSNGDNLADSTTSVTIDHHHPLFMHPSDAPGSLFVGIMLTGSDNYTLWSRAMKLALLGKNKLGFIDGSVSRDQFEGDLERLWDRCNAIIVSWIISNVGKDLLGGILFCSNTHLIWENLRERFDKINRSRTFQLHKKIFTSVQGVSSVSVYYSKLKDLWDEYDSIIPPPSCNCPKSREFFEHLQYQRVLQFLMGLNDHYSQARSQILMMQQVPNVNQVYAMINQDESQRIIVGSGRVLYDNTHPTAMFTKQNNGFPSKRKKPYNPNAHCDHCHTKGHLKADCFKLMKCDHCHNTGHLKINCYRLHGYPADFKGKRTTANVVAGPVLDNTHCFSNNAGQQEWTPQHTHFTQPQQHHYYNQQHHQFPTNQYQQLQFTPHQHQQLIDMLNRTSIEDLGGNSSGCANMAGLIENAGHVQLPTGVSARVSHVGDYHLEEGDVLKNVLCVPAFKFNLMSVSKMTKELDCSATFFPNCCIFQDLTSGKVRGIGKEEDGLYILHSKAGNNAAKCLVATTQSGADAVTWHHRLCHIPMSVLRKIPMFHANKTFVVNNCEVCPIARQTRLPFSHSVSKATSIFQLLHMDVWEPYKLETHDGMRYFLTIVDDHSRWTWIFLMRLKSDVLTLLNNFFLQVETQFDRKIKIVRSDNGAELFNHGCRELFQKHGVLHQSSCPYTP